MTHGFKIGDVIGHPGAYHNEEFIITGFGSAGRFNLKCTKGVRQGTEYTNQITMGWYLIRKPTIEDIYNNAGI
jgi:hypothetical protein